MLRDRRQCTAVCACVITLFVLWVPAALARDLRGHAEARGIYYPTLDFGEGRARLVGRYEHTIDNRVFIVASACVDGLAGPADRGTDWLVQPLENYIERRGSRMEIRLGMSNVAWGVLDELSPQDVVNPIDVSRFVLEGRSEARLPVPLARVRFFLPASLTLEALVVPYARRGVFDQLNETTSPFAPDGLAMVPRSETEVSTELLEGGLRFRGSGSGIDWGVSAFRDIVDFDRYEITATGLVARRPARWMAGGDIETTLGNWVLRGDAAVFIDDPLQVETVPSIVTHTTFQGGVGADRRAGDSAFYLNALYSFVPQDDRLDSADEVSIFGGFTRDFFNATTTLRLFGLWNTTSESGFGRAMWDQEIVQNLRLEISGSMFLGQGRRVIRLIEDADLVSAKLRFYF